MALLVIAFGVTFPTLRGFFRGRVLDNEARRMLALTRYGQSRAISEGIPMVLWIDPRQGWYGLQASSGFTDRDPRALEFQLDNDLSIEVSTPLPSRYGSRATETAKAAGTSTRSIAGLPTIRLLPEGYISDGSPEYVELREENQGTLWLVQTTNHVAYELRDEAPTRFRR